MNEQIPVNLLKESKINDWNEWRSQHSEQHLDLTNTDLSGLDLTGANLSNSNLSGVDLTGTNLQDTDFTEASNIKDIIIRNEKEDDFRNACRLLLKTGQKFFSINFDDQSLCYESQAGLEAILYEYFNNYYQSIDYSKYDEFYGIYMVDLETASYFAVINWGKPYEDKDDGWSFKYTHTTAEYNGENISNLPSKCKYGRGYSPDADKMEQFLILNRKSTKLISQQGSKNNLRDLRGKDLSDADLSDADLSDADLTNANLTNANLTNANLEYADLSDANLTNANLSGANLCEANLSGAFLCEADLSGANLTNANLEFADLSGSNLTDANLEGIITDENTKIEIPEE